MQRHQWEMGPLKHHPNICHPKVRAPPPVLTQNPPEGHLLEEPCPDSPPVRFHVKQMGRYLAVGQK